MSIQKIPSADKNIMIQLMDELELDDTMQSFIKKKSWEELAGLSASHLRII